MQLYLCTKMYLEACMENKKYTSAKLVQYQHFGHFSTRCQSAQFKLLILHKMCAPACENKAQNWIMRSSIKD